jgi:hypothetical protein
VTFNGTTAGVITSWSDTQIQVTVPVGATTGPVVVTVAGTSSNGMTFTVTAAAPPPPPGGGGGGGCAVAGSSSNWGDGVGAWGAYLLLAIGFAIRRCRMRRLAGVTTATVVAVFVLVSCAAVETKPEAKTTQTKEDRPGQVQAGDASSSMKQVLLNPKGFNGDWNCRGMMGRSGVVFRDVGSKIVVDIDSYGMGGCTTEVTITDNGILFDGCRERDFALTYDPGNSIPFKGRNRVGCLLELRSR